MRVALYFELYHWWGGRLFKGRGTGLVSAYKNQRAALQRDHNDHVAGRLEILEGPRLDVDVLQLNVPWLRSRWLMRRACQKGITVLLYAHTTVEDARGVLPLMRWFAPLYRWYLASAYQAADRVICPSAYTRALLLARYGVAPDRAEVVSNGVDTNKFSRDEIKRVALRKKIAPNNETVIGTVGLVVPRKGLETFLSVARQNPDKKFLWVGSFLGKQGRAIAAQALPASAAARPSKVTFTGYVPDLVAYYSALDIFLFPSLEENQGIAVLEAAACGLPLIVRDIPVYRGWLVHGENCLKAQTNQEFVKAIRRLQADATLRKKLAAAARVLAEKNDLTQVGEQLLKIYQVK